MGINANRSSELSEICTGFGLVTYILIVGVPFVVTPYEDKNYYTIGISSISAAITGLITIVCVVVNRQLKSMTHDELRTMRNRLWGDIEHSVRTESSEAIERRRDYAITQINKIGLFALASSITCFGIAYYHSSPYLIHA